MNTTASSDRNEAPPSSRESSMAAAQRIAHLGSWELALTHANDLDAGALHWSDEMFRIAGYEPGSVAVSRKFFLSLVPPADHEPVRQAMNAAIRERRSYSIVHRLLRPSGETRILHESGQVFFDESTGQPVKIIGIAHDITDRKRAEARSFESKKLESIGKLAGGVAHEYNNIMTIIIGQSELMLSGLPSGSPLRINLSEIRKAADRAAVLTRQLLAYGRQQILTPNILDLNTVIESMAGALRRTMGRKVDVRIVTTSGLGLVKADTMQIEQVILNIAKNSARAMPNGGKLTLETASVALDHEYVSHIPELKAGEYAMLAVTDTGAGMDEEMKARVFEPFFTTKGIGQGSGLGLSTCYGIVKQSGGHLSVYSEPGRGATFKIYLPQVEPQGKGPRAGFDAPELPRGKEVILLVEDDAALRDMASEMLRRLGYTVLDTDNGIDALSMQERRGIGQIDLLFTDIDMPQMSGLELSKRAQLLDPGIKILFTSAGAENAIIHQGLLKRGAALLQKPFTPSALTLKIRAVLDRKSG